MDDEGTSTTPPGAEQSSETAVREAKPYVPRSPSIDTSTPDVTPYQTPLEAPAIETPTGPIPTSDHRDDHRDHDHDDHDDHHHQQEPVKEPEHNHVADPPMAATDSSAADSAPSLSIATELPAITVTATTEATPLGSTLSPLSVVSPISAVTPSSTVTASSTVSSAVEPATPTTATTADGSAIPTKFPCMAKLDKGKTVDGIKLHSGDHVTVLKVKDGKAKITVPSGEAVHIKVAHLHFLPDEPVLADVKRTKSKSKKASTDAETPTTPKHKKANGDKSPRSPKAAKESVPMLAIPPPKDAAQAAAASSSAAGAAATPVASASRPSSTLLTPADVVQAKMRETSASDTMHQREELKPDQVDPYGFIVTDPEYGNLLYNAEKAMFKKTLEREEKWSKMLGMSERQGAASQLEGLRRSVAVWEDYLKKNPEKVKERCEKGIPNRIRGVAWVYLSGSYKLMLESKVPYDSYYPKEGDTSELISVIDRDLDRCYPEHERFRKYCGEGQQWLDRILKSYAYYDPVVGYCQGMGMVVGMMLMNMDDVDAFWLLAQTVKRYLQGFFDSSLTQVHVYSQVLGVLVKRYFPRLAALLDKYECPPLLYCTPWFMTMYTTTLPWPTVLRIWDILFCEGNLILLKVALGIFKELENDLLKSPGMMETLDILKRLPRDRMMPETLIRHALSFKLKESEIAELRAAVENERKK